MKAYFVALFGFILLCYVQRNVASLFFSNTITTLLTIASWAAAGFYAYSKSLSWKSGSSGFYEDKELVIGKQNVKNVYDKYEAQFGGKSRSGGVEHDKLKEQRKKSYAELVQQYYDLATDFYEYGWGQSFHFAARFDGEDFQESLRRAEYFLAAKIGANKQTHVIDLGCGVGGPMRNIARFVGTKVTGINISKYQITVGQRHTKEQHLEDLVTHIEGDFMKLPSKKESFDAAYTIEAVCHAPDRVGVFSEVFRVLKPGGLFAGYDWLMTDKYDEKNKVHVAIKEGIEVGNGLPTLARFKDCLDALKKAGFEVIEYEDIQKIANEPGQIPWYESLGGSFTLKGFRRTKLGRNLTTILVVILETLKIAPKGTTKVQKLLNATADDLYDGGRLGIFTPTFYFLARKPATARR